ncbi:MAG: hypothetical protein AB7I18_01720 [Candidatus Berkiella sp.]
MKNLTAGFALLRLKEYLQAYDYFCQKALEHKTDPKVLDTCLYGQARALNGLGDVEFAKAILFVIINGGSKWEQPFIMLARIYEKEGKIFQAQENHDQALVMFQKAHNVFLLACEQVGHTATLYDNFNYFKDHFFPQANVFTPAFDDAKSLALLPSFLREQVAPTCLQRRTIA